MSCRLAAVALLAAAGSSTPAARIGLAAVGAALVVLLLLVARQIDQQANALARRCRLERTAGSISSRLIGTRFTEVDAAVVAALDSIALATGAQRAYLLMEGCSRSLWVNHGAVLAADWPARALRMTSILQPAQDGAVLMSRRHQAPPALRQALVAADIESLALVWATRDGGGRAMLGLDTRKGPLDLLDGELGVLRLVLDATAGVARRARLEHLLQDAGRLEALGSFASGIAHNFNNILAAIGGYAEMAQDSAANAGSIGRQIGEIQQAVATGRDLVDRILIFGQRRGNPRQTIDLAGVVRDAAALLSAVHGGEAEFSLDLQQAPRAVIGDPVDLQQVVLNLGANAVRAMDGRGRVRITVDRRLILQSRVCAVGELGPGRYARIAVQDSGCGMPPSVLGRIFEPFFTTAAGGHGLGLATVGEIVRDHGGGLDVCSEPGLGATFEVWLPHVSAVSDG